MKKLIQLFSFFALLVSAVTAQEPAYYELDQGAGYVNAVYWNISDDSKTTISHTAWDIAFGVGPFSAAVFVNDGVGGTQQNPQSEAILFTSSATDFATADTTQITGRMYNLEEGWSGGAFNHIADPSNPADLGWGTYNFATQVVNGSRVFFIVDRTGTYRKLMIESLASGVYTMRYANLDGTDEQTATVTKSEFAGKTLAYFSFENGVQDLEPAEWDLLFTRYQTPLAFGPGTFIDYTVTGVLHNDNRAVVEYDEVDPLTVAVPAADDEDYMTNLDMIGYDWKSFNGSDFDVDMDRVYFLKNLGTEQVYRIQFIDFDRTTGVSSVAIIDEGVISNIYQQSVYANAVSVYPNPAYDQANLEIEAAQNAELEEVTIINAIGQTVRQVAVDRPLEVGRNQLSLDVANLAAGQYYVHLKMNNGVAIMPLNVK